MNDQSIVNLTSKQLRQAATITERIQKLQTELNRLLGGTAVETPRAKPAKRKRKMSAQGRANIRAGVKARWAKVAAEKAKSAVESKPKRKVAAEGKTRL